MPVYEYECQACKYYTEVMQKITDAPLIKCPSCGKRRLKRLVSAPVFRLKGGGWYETDFKSDKEGKRNLLAAEKEEAKSESKPQAKEAAASEKDAAGKDVAAKETKESATASAGKGEKTASGERGTAAGGAGESTGRSRRRAVAARAATPSRRAVRRSARKSGRSGRR
jgi:putative FmdB family regulatory protein